MTLQEYDGCPNVDRHKLCFAVSAICLFITTTSTCQDALAGDASLHLLHNIFLHTCRYTTVPELSSAWRVPSVGRNKPHTDFTTATDLSGYPGQALTPNLFALLAASCPTTAAEVVMDSSCQKPQEWVKSSLNLPPQTTACHDHFLFL